eukprot:4857026-Pyramimonas_sp.AAC.1
MPAAATLARGRPGGVQRPSPGPRRGPRRGNVPAHVAQWVRREVGDPKLNAQRSRWSDLRKGVAQAPAGR